MGGRRCSYAMALALLVLSHAPYALATGPVDGGMPNRISMNVTVPKQTQGATFGEKVNAGLHAAGNVAAAGGTVVVECGRDACAVAFPDGQGYRADTRRQTLRRLSSAEATALLRGTPPDRASLLGATLPGAGIISATVSSVGNLAGGVGGAAAASDAATGRTAGGKEGLASAIVAPGVIDVAEPLLDGEYMLVVVVAGSRGPLQEASKTRAGMANSGQVTLEVGFSVEDGVLKTRHDTVKNSISNIR